jgi:hypothetical protein
MKADFVMIFLALVVFGFLEEKGFNHEETFNKLLILVDHFSSSKLWTQYVGKS